MPALGHAIGLEETAPGDGVVIVPADIPLQIGIGADDLLGPIEDEGTRVIGHSHYTHFMRNGSDTILLAHPSEVSPFPVSPSKAEG
jgi:hypothetical protein